MRCQKFRGMYPHINPELEYYDVKILNDTDMDQGLIIRGDELVLRPGDNVIVNGVRGLLDIELYWPLTEAWRALLIFLLVKL
jgi:hypothetical protein